MTPQIDETSIRQAAYFLWLNDGQPMGGDQDYWLRAEAELSKPAAPKKKAAPRKPAARKAAPKAGKPATAAKPRARKTKAAAKA